MSDIGNLTGGSASFPYRGPVDSEDYNHLVCALYADLQRVGNPTRAGLMNDNFITPSMIQADVGSFLYMPMLSSYEELEIARWGQWNAIMIPAAVFPYRDKRVKSTHVDRLKHSPVGRKIVYTIMSAEYGEVYSPFWSSGWIAGTPSWIESFISLGRAVVDHEDEGWTEHIDDVVWNVMAYKPDGVVLKCLADPTDSSIATLIRLIGSIKSQPGNFDTILSLPAASLETLTTTVALSGYDGVLVENLFYSNGVATDTASLSANIAQLTLLKADGKRVYVVEYLDNESAQMSAYSNCTWRGYALALMGNGVGRVYESPSYGPWRAYSMTFDEKVNHYYTSGEYLKRMYL